MKFPSYLASAMCGLFCIPVFCFVSINVSIDFIKIILFFLIIGFPISMAVIDFDAMRKAYRKKSSFLRMEVGKSFLFCMWLRMGLFFICTVISISTIKFIGID